MQVLKNQTRALPLSFRHPTDPAWRTVTGKGKVLQRLQSDAKIHVCTHLYIMGVFSKARHKSMSEI